MKIRRYKRVQRYMGFYTNNFGFRSPYQVLIDGTFCQAALKYKVNIKEQMPKYLNSDVKLLTTVCVVNETEKLGPAIYGAMLVVKQFQVIKCGHEKNPISASDCLFSAVKEDNPDHYLIATQDPELSEKVRIIPGCPLLYLKFNAINLEKPSEISEEAADTSKECKLNPSAHHLAVLEKLKQDLALTDRTKRKRKRKKGPNPLACKKKKKKRIQDSDQNLTKRKRKRHKRLKIAKHVKVQLLNA
ncbi:rRNA-processing protein UTP23 homolog [Centruroides vittatus]|uniref:rRNA-processing protein UTP23 homolog n=1 Tax=Centruroides vittatus TaxID=120091 RepID=UPI00350FEEF6